MNALSFSLHRARRRGMALLLVLAAIVLVSLLTVAFLLSMNHELVSSKSYASGSSSRIFADSAVSLVIGQLQAGTTQDNSARTWVSQPGLIRIYDTAGAMVNAYKLYSSSKMVDTGTFAPMDSSGNPADVPAWTAATPQASLPWVQYPNVYVDLNDPITVNSVAKYPVLNPGGLNASTQIEGFSVGAQVSGNSALSNQIPMPVTWLYILTDGRIATPATNPSDPTSVTLTTADGQPVAASNPPVSRVAFWTDDDTCRLNINTASEGSYWAIPVDEVGGDVSLSRNQINSKEYQRYPGHPATTSLSPVFDYLTSNNSDLRNFIFSLTPRISGRGSQFGTRTIGYGLPVNLDSDRLYASVDELLFLPKVNSVTGQRYSTTTANIQTIDTALPDNKRHLDWNFTNPGVLKSMTGTPYSFSSSFALDPSHLELARFFLTTDSRAPEINLFGQPRLSLWPVDTRADHQSAWDKTLAFAATAGGKLYYFQRQNPNSQSEDYNSIKRNMDLYAYLDHATSTAIPGLGGNFSTKYSAADRAQDLTSMFDWIRTVNLAYPDLTGTVKDYAWTPNSAYNATTSAASMPPGQPGSGQVLPIKIGATQGYGRFPTLSKAAVAIIRESEQADTPAAGQTTVNYRIVYLMETYVPEMGYAGYIPDYHIQVSGLASAFNFVTVTPATASSPITQPVTWADGDIHVTAPANFEHQSGRAWGGTQGFNNLFVYSDSGNNYQLTARTLNNNNSDTGYPFVSQLLSVVYPTTDKGLIKVGLAPVGGTATVNMKFYDSADSNLIATYAAAFPAFSPLTGAFLSTTGTSTYTVSGNVAQNPGTSNQPNDLKSRIDQMVAASNVITVNPATVTWPLYKNVIGLSDVVRGMELGHGDLRISAITGTDANSKFVTHKSYTDTTYAAAHSLLGSAGQALTFDAASTISDNSSWRFTLRGTLVPGAFNNPGTGKPTPVWASWIPQCPSAMTAATSPPGFPNGVGDFSNGLGSESDGPHIMKADEGNSSFLGVGRGQSAAYPYLNQYFPYDNDLALAFSPNRQVASAVQFGTLPSQPKTPVPWQTLLFHPDYTGIHPGATAPADSLLLDLFWMPVTDPYAISEEYSTAGKVNMNYQIVPFTYITRSTAMIGALKATKIEAIPVEQFATYKLASWTAGSSEGGPDSVNYSHLYAVDPVKTLLFFTERFSNSNPSGNIFKSASEICSIPLAPMQTLPNLINTGYPASPPDTVLHSVNVYGAADAATLRSEITKFWSYNTLTGDNSMEEPYNALYPRLTTQSNTYTVYVRAQALQVTGSTGGGVFTNIASRVTGEYRGSYEVERYIDLNDPNIPDFTLTTNYNKTIYPYYKFRILSYKQFLP